MQRPVALALIGLRRSLGIADRRRIGVIVEEVAGRQ